jgi:hypothetical protein
MPSPDLQPTALARIAPDTGEVRIARTVTLDRWVAHVWERGVQLDRLEYLQALCVRTRNSTYDLVILSGPTGEVLVRGGRYFPAWTRAHLAGSSLGGGLLKRHGIHGGMRMEIHFGDRRLVTSTVQAIRRGTAASQPRPF